MSSIRINLMPVDRLNRQKRSIALYRWAACSVLTLIVCGALSGAMLLVGDDRSSILLVRAGEQRVQIGTTTKNNENLVKEIKSLTAQAESVSMLDRRINWRGIFEGIAAASENRVFFMQIRCDTQTNESLDRVEIVTNGFAESQGIARSFVVSLERVGLFDQVVLENTGRVEFKGTDYISFQIRLVVDPLIASKDGE
ncbi:MAG: hypothetical protein KC996_07045 [Phycisphaerales bacterium]|nr:hypothetical protein [Phycisphaerales bacterium]